MKPLATRGLQEGRKAKVRQAIAQLVRRLDHSGEGKALIRVKIEHEATGQGGVARHAVPGVELDGGGLGCGDQRVHRIELRKDGARAFNRHMRHLRRFPQAAAPLTLVALVEELACDILRSQQHGAWPASDIGEQPFGCVCLVCREVSRGYASGWPEQLVSIGEGWLDCRLRTGAG